jgi:hypothetical protein
MELPQTIVIKTHVPPQAVQTLGYLHQLSYHTSYRILLVGYPCVVTAYNNTYVNYPQKNQDFLLIVSALRIIFFLCG